MGYRLLADFIVLLHGAFILFAVLGWLLVLGSRRWAWLHVPAFLWAGFIELSGGICPLTPLENILRAQGGGAAYREDFIGRHLLPLLYPEDMTRTVQITLGLFVILLNAGAYATILYRSRRRSKD